MLAAGVMATAWAGAASGTLVAYDPFLTGSDRGAGEYTAGNDMRTMGAAALGWVGTSGIDGFGAAHAGTTSNFSANALGEDSTAVSYEGTGRLQWGGVGNFPFDRNLTRQLNPIPSSSTYWMSIMVNRLGSGWDGTGNTYAVGGFTDGSGDGLQVGYDNTADDTPDLVLRMGGVNEVLLADAPSSDNQFVIIKLDINTSGNDTVEVWVDPDSVFDASDITFTGTNVTDSLTPFTQSKYESPGKSGNTFFDEIRLSTTFEALIPEPASAALFGMGAMLIGRRRRSA